MRRIMSRRSRYAAAGMSPCTAKIKSLYRGAIISMAQEGAGAKHLVQAHMAMHNIPFCQAKDTFQIQRA